MPDPAIEPPFISDEREPVTYWSVVPCAVTSHIPLYELKPTWVGVRSRADHE